jgi:hypothetical protein
MIYTSVDGAHIKRSGFKNPGFLSVNVMIIKTMAKYCNTELR